MSISSLKDWHGLARSAWAVALIVALLVATAPGSPRAEKVEIESPRFEIDQEQGLYRYTDARLKLGTLVVHAGLLEFDESTRLVRASDNVRLENGAMLGRAERLELNVDTRITVLHNANLFDVEKNLYLEAERIILPSQDRILAENCSVTSCRPTDGGWKLKASELDYRLEDYAVATNPRLLAGAVPVFWLPAMAWPTVRERRSGLLRPGYTEQASSLARFNLGTRVKVPYFLALDVDQDLTLSPEYISRRGLATNVEYKYAFWLDQRASLRFYHIEETHPRNPGEEHDILPEGAAETRSRTPTRSMVDYGHNQGFGDQTRVVLAYNHSSDGQVRREYDGTANYRPFQSLHSGLSEQARWGNVSFFYEQTSEYSLESLYADSARYTDRDLRPQLQPSLRYHIGTQYLGSLPLGLKLSTAAARFKTPKSLSGQYESAAPSISLPLKLGTGLEFRPTLTRRFVQYSSLQDNSAEAAQKSLHPEAFSQNVIELELRNPLARIFQGTRATKHRMVPRLIYFEVEDVEQPHTDLVVPTLFAQRLLTLRLDNDFLRPIPLPGGGIRGHQAAKVNVIQRYNLLRTQENPKIIGPALPEPQETDPGEPLLPLIVDSSVAVSAFTINLNLHFNHQLSRITENIFQVGGSVDPRTRLNIAYHENQFAYRTPDGRLIGAATNMQFGGELTGTDVLSFAFSTSLNLTNSDPPLGRRLDNVSLVADYHPLCYGLGLGYTERVSVTTENGEDRFFLDRSINLIFNLGGFFSGSTQEFFDVGTL